VHRRRDFISERLGALAVERDIRLIISSPRQKQQEDDVTSIIVRKILGWRSVPRQSTSLPSRRIASESCGDNRIDAT
jgi:hypothetical protein